VFSSIIRGFDFTSDSLVCVVEPSTTYTITTQLQSSSFTSTAPGVANHLYFVAGDGSGGILAPPSPGWTADQPAWDDSLLPVFATTGNFQTIGLSTQCSARLIKFTATTRTGGVVVSLQNMDWCVVRNSSDNGATIAASPTKASNCVFDCSANSYAAVVQNVTYCSNCRITGAAGVSGPTRRGIDNTSAVASAIITRSFIGGVGGNGINIGTTSASQTLFLSKSDIVNVGGDGVLLPATVSQTGTSAIVGCMVTGNSGSGINAQSGTRVFVADCRLRDNAGGNFNGLQNWPTTELGANYVTDDSDSVEYVEPQTPLTSAGDYRIKSTATNVYNKGLGVSDQASTASNIEPAFTFIK
jgi:hypothetical protein